MNIFKRKEEKAINSEEYETLSKRLTDLNSRLLNLEYENEALRNKVLRKIQKQREKEGEETLDSVTMQIGKSVKR